MSDKTEEATPQRLRKAQEEGDSGVSAYMGQAVGFMAALAIVPAAVGAIVSFGADSLRSVIARVAIDGKPDVVHFDMVSLAEAVLALTLPVLLAAGIAAAVTSFVQTGGAFASKRLAPDLARLNPVTGFRNLFQATRLFAVARSLVAACAVGYLAFDGLKTHVVDTSRLAGRLPYTGVVIRELAMTLCWRAGAIGLALGFVDLLVTRSVWKRRLRMSKDEVKREHKDQDGDPEVKAERARARQELMAQVTVASVRQASVVVVNPTHLACALRYDAAVDEAPMLVASGDGALAGQIRQAAEQWGIPVLRDVPLARALFELPIGDAIPEALYAAVAEILREVQEDRQRKEVP